MLDHQKSNEQQTEIKSSGTSMNALAGRKTISQTMDAITGKKTISRTAEAMAMFRAIAAMEPDEKIRNNDVFAEKFVPPEKWGTYLMTEIIGKDFASFKRVLKINHNPTYFYINARTRHIDSLLADALRDGVTQVIILGAGYASRAYRFQDNATKVKFFEVDLADIQADKIAKVNELWGKLPDWVTYCSVDFHIQTLETELKKAGYDEAKKSFFIWEGVTMYITPDAVGSTLGFIAEHSAPGSSVIFDYILQPVLEGDYRYYGANMAAAAVTLMGEPYMFGIPDGEIESFTNQYGLNFISDLGPQELTQEYLVRSNGKVDGRTLGYFRVAYANVPDKNRRAELMKKTYQQVQPETLPETHMVEVPADIQAFLDQFSRDFLTHEHEKIMSNFSDKFLDDGATKDTMSYFWAMIFQYPFVKGATYRKTILTDLQVNGDIASYSGFTKSNTCYDLAEETIIRENGQWKIYGNQKTADQD